MSRILKSGVYLVAMRDQESFFKDAELSGWTPFYKPSTNNPETIIPMSLDREKPRIGHWCGSHYRCHSQKEAQEIINNWDDWRYTEKYIELYKANKLLL